MIGADRSSTPGPIPSSRLEGLRPYAPPVPSHAIDLHLDANEGPGPSASALRAIAAVTAETIRRYPDASALESKLASRLGTDPRRVLVTNGGDDAIDRACRAVLEPGRSALLHAPTFEMIPRGVRLNGAASVEIPWRSEKFPAAAFLDALRADRDNPIAMVALVTPNNPTGGVIPLADILAIADAAPRALVLVDLAYVEFADRDPTPELLGRSNIMLVRTFSKARGLAGLRLGYAVAAEPIIAMLRTAGGPYPVSPISIAAACASLDDEAHLSEIIDRVRTERDRLSTLLKSKGVQPMPTQANFVTARFDDAELIRGSLAARGIAVRGWPDRPDLEGLLRITLPASEHAFARLTTALTEILEGTAS